MRRDAHSSLVIFCLAFAVAGCPNTNGTKPTITDVETDGEANTLSFRLKVSGRGFGLKSVQFDLAKQEGVVTPGALTLQIERSGQLMHRIDQVEVESPRVLYGQVTLSDPLPGDSYYDVALLESGTEVARKDQAFYVPVANAVPDAGVEDTGVLAKDGGPIDGEIDEDAGVVDAEPIDGDTPDVPNVDDGGAPDGGVGDSGLGPFQGAYAFRRLITPTNTVVVPAGVTILIPVPHATMLADGTAEDEDGADLAVYQGPDRLQHQWSDQFALGTDSLVIVARLLRDLPIGGSENDPLVLYSGDPNANDAATDAVFEFAERFRQPVGNGWFEAGPWNHCNVDRPNEVVYDPNAGPFGAYCAIDNSNANPSRSTLATPRLQTVVSQPGANLIYEMSVWQAGRTIDGPADILYFAYGNQNDRFDNTYEPDVGAYSGYVPNATLTFEDTDDDDRTVNGWRHPPDVIEWWQRTTLRFVPVIDRPSLHWRYVSTNPNATNASASIIDDWWLRLAVDPDFTPILGPVEAR